MAFIAVWLISGFMMEYQIVNNLSKSGSSELIFYSITVVEQPIITGEMYEK